MHLDDLHQKLWNKSFGGMEKAIFILLQTVIQLLFLLERISFILANKICMWLPILSHFQMSMELPVGMVGVKLRRTRWWNCLPHGPHSVDACEVTVNTQCNPSSHLGVSQRHRAVNESGQRESKIDMTFYHFLKA